MKGFCLISGILLLGIAYSHGKNYNSIKTTQTSYRCPKLRPRHCPNFHTPVCGYYDPTKLQCFRAPCAGNYDNPCKACADSNVESVMCGKCPMNPINSEIVIKYIGNERRWSQCS